MWKDKVFTERHAFILFGSCVVIAVIVCGVVLYGALSLGMWVIDLYTHL